MGGLVSVAQSPQTFRLQFAKEVSGTEECKVRGGCDTAVQRLRNFRAQFLLEGVGDRGVQGERWGTAV